LCIGTVETILGIAHPEPSLRPVPAVKMRTPEGLWRRNYIVLPVFLRLYRTFWTQKGGGWHWVCEAQRVCFELFWPRYSPYCFKQLPEGYMHAWPIPCQVELEVYWIHTCNRCTTAWSYNPWAKWGEENSSCLFRINPMVQHEAG
jgi:hypothetical protein